MIGSILGSGSLFSLLVHVAGELPVDVHQLLVHVAFQRSNLCPLFLRQSVALRAQPVGGRLNRHDQSFIHCIRVFSVLGHGVVGRLQTSLLACQPPADPGVPLFHPGCGGSVRVLQSGRFL